MVLPSVWLTTSGRKAQSNPVTLLAIAPIGQKVDLVLFPLGFSVVVASRCLDWLQG